MILRDTDAGLVMQIGPNFPLQVVSRNGDRENDLLRMSEIDSRPHEVGQFSFRLSDGRVLRSNLLSGQGTTIDLPITETLAALRLALRNAEQSGVRVDEIVFDHTHPAAGWIEISSDGRVTVQQSSLSGADLEVAASLSATFPDRSFTMRAVSPYGLTYAVQFRNGRPTTP